MKIYFNPSFSKMDNVTSLSYEQAKENNHTTNTFKTDLKNMPNYQYQVSFGAMNTNLENLYKAFGQGKGMPETYNKVLSEMTNTAREAITNVYAHYRSIYAPLEECHNTESIKKLFPAEFSGIQSGLTRKSNNGSFISKVTQWAKLFEGESDNFLFPETKDNDLTVYLAKKLFLEAKTKQEIKDDFFKDINREILSEEDIQELMVTTQGTKTIPNSVFAQLGLQGKFEANGFRHSLLRSREDYIQKYGSVYLSKRKAVFDKTVETVISTTNSDAITLPKRGSANYEKSQYAMFDAWNNSIDLKMAMSEFLTGKKTADEMLMPDLMSIHTLKIKKDETQMQKSLMQEFWAKHPALKGEFSNRCKDSFDKVEKAIDEGKFDELKREIDAKRQCSFMEMKALKETREREILEQKKLEEEKLKIKELNNKLYNKLKLSIINIRKHIPIPEKEVEHSTQYFFNKLKDKEIASQKGYDSVLEKYKDVMFLANEKSFKKILKYKLKNDKKNMLICYKQMKDQLEASDLRNTSENFKKDFLQERFQEIYIVLYKAYVNYLLFICNNISKNPQKKAKRKEMEKIINNILKDDNISKKLNFNGQKELLKLNAMQITDISSQEIEKNYADCFNKTLKELFE